MRMGVLGPTSSWYLADLRRAAAGEHEIVAIDYFALESLVDGPPGTRRAGQTRLEDCDALLVRSMPPGSLEQVVLRMDLLALAESAGTVVLNPPRAVETAVDKFLTTGRLAQAGLPVPATWVGQTPEGAMAAFEHLGGDVVVKPLFGSEGRGLVRVSDEDLAWRAFHLLARQQAVIYLQQFIPHEGWDLRVLLIGAKAWSIRREAKGDWRTNLSRGARAVACEIEGEPLELARRAAQLTEAPLAGVDLLLDRAGRWLVLEVNAVPGWKGLAKATGTDIAAEVLDFVARRTAEPSGR